MITLRKSGLFLALCLCWSSVAAEQRPAPLSVLTLDATRGEEVIAVFDELSGVITLASGLAMSDPEYKYISVRRYSYFDGKFLRAADLNGDQKAELIVPAYSANQVLVLWGADWNEREIEFDSFVAGPGPAAIVPAQLNNSPVMEVVVAATAQSRVQVRGWDAVRKQPVTEPAHFPADFGLEGILGFETAPSARGAANPPLAIMRRDRRGGPNPVLELFAHDPSPAYGPNNSIQWVQLARPYTHLTSGFPEGGDSSAWLLAWAPGVDALEMLPAIVPGNGMRQQAGPWASETIDFEGRAVHQVTFLPELDDEVLVIFEGGGAGIYSFSPGEGFSLVQEFEPEEGLDFLGGTTVNDQLLLLAGSPGNGVEQFNLYEHNGPEFELTAQGDWPAAPLAGSGVTVVLYTGDPFTNPAPFPFETFMAGDWASMVSFDDGEISASVETFGGTAEGLGGAAIQNLFPESDPGAGAGALGNQWEPSSSLFHAASGLLGPGLAAATIDPPAGTYATTIAVSFQAGPDVDVYYRVNQNPWQTGLGPIFITQDATIQFYGEHQSGVLSSIQSAVYEIDQFFGFDSDGDLVPDAIEALAGSDPFLPDSDGDGFDDFTEILEGTDPADPNSHPADVQALGWHNVIATWTDPASDALPAANQGLRIADLFNGDEGTAPPSGGETRRWSKPLRGELKSRIIKLWLPAGYLVPGEPPQSIAPPVTAFGILPPAPVPDIPLDLSAADPLAAWRASAQEFIEAAATEPVALQIGPSTTVAALLFEFWYAGQLAGLPHPASFANPRLADTPRSARAGVPAGGDLLAIETPSEPDWAAYYLADVIDQINHAILETPAAEPFRETAEAIYSQAIQAAREGEPWESPLEGLRHILAGEDPPQTYTLPIPASELIELRDQLIENIQPRVARQVTGVLELLEGRAPHTSLSFVSEGERLLLLDKAGRPFRPAGAGVAVHGSVASMVVFDLARIAPAGFDRVVEVVSSTVTSLPETIEPDINGNGIPDAWELAFLGTLAFGAGDDPDGDGFTLGEEYAGGSDPANPLSTPSGAPAAPRNLALTLDGAGIVRIEWEGSFTVNYQLLFSIDLVEWQPHPGEIVREGASGHAVEIELEEQSAFFRVRSL